jgi:hypothetical protein
MTLNRVAVFQGAGLSGRRANLIASSVQYVLNVAFTVPAIICTHDHPVQGTYINVPLNRY